jgi:DNA-directed RNA polymerase specialized sigma subunit
MTETGEIIIDIKENGENRYNDLWEQVKRLVFSIAFDYARKYDFEFDDVKQNAYIAWKSLSEGFSMNKMTEGNIESNYISYINKYLPKRLHNYAEDYSIFNDWKIISYDQFSDPCFLSDELVDEGHGELDDTVVMTIENNLDKLTEKEKETYFLLKEGYRQVDIANKLDLARSTVHARKERLFKKVKKIAM